MYGNFKFVVLVFWACLQKHAEPKDQYVQPMMMGMQVAIPYDIANIFNRPVSLSPFLSTFLGLSLLYILFFGVITSPFGYMFGVPSQKYVLGIGDASLVGSLVKAAEQWDAIGKTDTPRTISKNFVAPVIREIIEQRWEYPDFSKAIFQFTPEKIGDDLMCQELVLCYAHSSLHSLPEISLPLFRVFSKTLVNVTERHRQAIVLGLGQENCDDFYSECSFDIYSLVARTFSELVPKWLRRSFILPEF